MKIGMIALLLLGFAASEAQQVIPLYSGPAPGSGKWDWQEGEMYSDIWQTRVVYNVATPTLTAYLPAAGTANGTAVVICPGGGFHALSIDSEGIDVAKWLNAKGIAAFVLKYRLVKSETKDPVKELSAKMAQGDRFDKDNARLIPLAISDGLQAVTYLRKHAREYKLNPRRIGIIGFSAGGTVTTGVAYQGKGDSRADFVAPVYAYIPPSLKAAAVPENAPPMFVVAASDDQLGLAPHSIALFNKWLDAKKSTEIHLYSQGGHGFGMRTQNLPSDTWIARFGEWLEIQGLSLPSERNNGAGPITPQQMQRKKEADERLRNDWAYLERFREENEKLGPPKAGENRVVFMGNSITARWSGIHPEFFAGKPYINRGIGGQTTPQMLIRFKQDVIDLEPKAVVILAGINDIAQATGPTTIKAIMNNVSGMALLAKANGIKVILSSVLPAYDFPSKRGLEPAGKVVKLNEMIKDFAAKNEIYYLDYFSPMVDERQGLKKELSNDEVHPTLDGYKVMEPLVEKAIETVLKRK
jgi:acetyl esterase/lipase/lysophospholipase L1-like esterase